MEFVTFEIAKKLKEKGFPQSTDYFNYSSYYDWDGFEKKYTHYLSQVLWFDSNISRNNLYFAPAISQVLKWLRGDKGLHICISLGGFSDWDYEIALIDGNILCAVCEDSYPSYELAALAGIEYCLDNLI